MDLGCHNMTTNGTRRGRDRIAGQKKKGKNTIIS